MPDQTPAGLPGRCGQFNEDSTLGPCVLLVDHEPLLHRDIDGYRWGSLALLAAHAQAGRPIDLNAVTDLLAELPRGPWHVERLGSQGYPQRISNAGAILIAETFTSPSSPPAIAEFIAQAREIVPRMATEIASLRDKVTRLRRQNEAFRERLTTAEPANQDPLRHRDPAALQPKGFE